MHTGGLPFENLKPQKWLQSYYEVLDILCRHLEHDLDDLLGSDEAEAARELLKGSAKELRSSVKESISAHKKVFNDKLEEEKQQLRNDALIHSRTAKSSAELSELVDCPGCSSSGLVTGRLIRSAKPYYDEGRLLQEVTGLSESYSCHACGLILPSASHLRWSGIDPQFTVLVETSLHELQEFDYYDDYMNE